MQIEYEATFYPVKKDEIRRKLIEVGAKLKKTEYVQKRYVFHMPSGHEIFGGWVRVRDEGDKVTMSLKVVDGVNIENQKEICLRVDNFDVAVSLLESLGCKRKAYQETRREMWQVDDVEVCIDEWPWLEPFVEIEGVFEQAVKKVSELIGFDYKQAKFCSVDTLFAEKYGIANDVFNNQTELIVFDGINPFVK